MRKISVLAAGAATGVVLLGVATPAIAGPALPMGKPKAVITVTPTTLYQGESTLIHAHCWNKLTVPVVTSALLTGPVTGKVGKDLDIPLSIGKTVIPQTYGIALQ